ncbi:thioredoxin domain-containing protein [Candidatus Pelagibacter sp.]|nr:thioredoxin domain-containing protein [Candidatus Pelagibacter sp.]
MVNLLKNEKSPYLKQHENNPVNWMPWNKETLKLARVEKKPIFLSVGYASCHWCHVMAHESFEDETTAKLLNEKFINIKVDREERPDLDYIFQRCLGILTGTQGGWPLSMFLDENAVPFTGGTYFPPKEMHGRPSFTKVLENVSKVYEENREKIISQVEQIKMIFNEINSKNAVLNQDLEPFAEKILQYMDNDNGGFQGAPKFPQFYVFDTIFYFYLKNKKKKFYEVTEKLLKNICSKGIYDQLGGGISRYTVDDKWVVPHFEKMLYDNILFVRLLNFYVENTKNKYFKSKLVQSINFIHKEFNNKDNLLGSAYDADSEGVEGKYYIWKYQEIKNILKEKFELFNKKYEISESGNFEGNNILVEKSGTILNDTELEAIKEIENKLLEERNKRVKPLFDHKTQTDLNSYWIYTILHSSIVLENQEIFKIAMSYLNKIQNVLKDNLFHCYDKKREEIDVFLEDYVYFSLLLVSVYEITNDKKSLDQCCELLKKAWELFYNDENQVLQKNIKKSNDLFVQPIDLIDNNIQNGNSIFLLVCNKLFNITEEISWKNKIDILKKSFHSSINNAYSQMFSYVKILDICNDNITFTFSGNDKSFKDIQNKLLKKYFEKATFIHKDSAENFILICKNQTCSEKLKSLEEVEVYINAKSI